MKIFAEIFMYLILFCMFCFISIYLIQEIKQNYKDSHLFKKSNKTPEKLLKELEKELNK